MNPAGMQDCRTGNANKATRLQGTVCNQQGENGMTGLGRSFFAAACLALTCLASSAVLAQSVTVTVECHSVSYQYSECRAPLRAPQLIHQISSSSCILNRTWGFDRRRQRLWVDQGCAPKRNRRDLCRRALELHPNRLVPGFGRAGPCRRGDRPDHRRPVRIHAV